MIVTGVAVLAVVGVPSAFAAPHGSFVRPHGAFPVERRASTALPNSAYGVTWVTDGDANSVSEYAAGASGAAVQNLNIMLGLAETTGLT